MDRNEEIPSRMKNDRDDHSMTNAFFSPFCEIRKARWRSDYDGGGGGPDADGVGHADCN